MATNVATPLYQQLTAEFEAARNSGSEAISALRNNAFSFFREKGFPSIREEDWRFTNLVPFLDVPLEFTPAPVSEEELKKAVETNLIPELDGYRLVLVNGSINKNLSVLPEGDNLTVQPLKNISDSESFRELTRYKDGVGGNSLVALNTALFSDGYYIEVKKNAEIDKPVLLLHIYTCGQNTFVQPRHMLVANPSSKIELVERSVVLKQDSVFVANSVCEIVVKENARVSQYLIQYNQKNERWLNYTHVNQARSSRYDNYTVTLPGSDLVRNNLDVSLNGTTTESHLYGLYLVAGNQVTDNHTAIHHIHPNCQSNELYKGVIKDSGKAVFNGKVYVEKEAQQTNAYQQNNNLLLSDKAQVYAKPQLEIFADDVKCSHGCTIGQFNPESLFYLRSRGIGEEASRKLLIEAFAFDIIDKFGNEAVKNYVRELLYANL